MHNSLHLNATLSSSPLNKLASMPGYFIGPYHSSTDITVLTLVSSLVLLGFVVLYVWRCIPRPASLSSIGICPSTVRSLPMISYVGDVEHMIDCVICLSEFQQGETVKLIPYCGHVFHPECLETWLLSHMTCPLCRSTQMYDAQEVRLPVRETEDDQSPTDQESPMVEDCDTREEVEGHQVEAITWSP